MHFACDMLANSNMLYSTCAKRPDVEALLAVTSGQSEGDSGKLSACQKLTIHALRYATLEPHMQLTTCNKVGANRIAQHSRARQPTACLGPGCMSYMPDTVFKGKNTDLNTTQKPSEQ